MQMSVPPFQGCFVSGGTFASQEWALMMGFEGGTASFCSFCCMAKSLLKRRISRHDDFNVYQGIPDV